MDLGTHRLLSPLGRQGGRCQAKTEKMPKSGTLEVGEAGPQWWGLDFQCVLPIVGVWALSPTCTASETLRPRMLHLLLSTFAVLQKSEAAVWNSELFSNGKGNQSRCKISSGDKAENQEVRIPSAHISVPMDWVFLWIWGVRRHCFLDWMALG